MNHRQEPNRAPSGKSTRREFLDWTGSLAIGSAVAGMTAPAGRAAEKATSELPGQAKTQEDFGPPVWPPFDKVEATLKHWARTHPDLMRLETASRSTQGKGLYVVRLTDPKVDDADKEHALVTALHSGHERSGSNTVLAIIEWLLSDEPLAREILRRQVVVCLPIPDPDHYVTGGVSTCYSSWTLDGPHDPEHSPEAMVVKRMMDEYQPEVHADIHGTNLAFARYIMFESSGASYSNLALRPYHRDIMRQMDEAALAEGYPSDTLEADAERLFWGPGVDHMSPKLWVGRPNVYAAVYCYGHYHTIVSASEVGWERSGLLRHRRLLEIGNETWPGEYYRGYPTRVVTSNTHAKVAAYGQTASMRRRSRVELWNKLPQITLGLLDPVVDGRAVTLCATSTAATRKWLSSPSLKAVVSALQSHPRMNADAIAQFTDGWPAGQNSPEAFFALGRGGGAAKPGEESPIQHGLCLRLRLPYRNAKILDLRVNGYPVAASEKDGSLSWVARGSTYVQINLSPSRLRTDELFVVTCQYDPGEKRSHWDSWRAIAGPPG